MTKNIVLCILAVLAVAACGVKPKSLKQPEGSGAVYPQSYPAPDSSE